MDASSQHSSVNRAQAMLQVALDLPAFELNWACQQLSALPTELQPTLEAHLKRLSVPDKKRDQLVENELIDRYLHSRGLVRDPTQAKMIQRAGSESNLEQTSLPFADPARVFNIEKLAEDPVGQAILSFQRDKTRSIDPDGNLRVIDIPEGEPKKLFQLSESSAAIAMLGQVYGRTLARLENPSELIVALTETDDITVPRALFVANALLALSNTPHGASIAHAAFTWMFNRVGALFNQELAKAIFIITKEHPLAAEREITALLNSPEYDQRAMACLYVQELDNPTLEMVSTVNAVSNNNCCNPTEVGRYTPMSGPAFMSFLKKGSPAVKQMLIERLRVPSEPDVREESWEGRAFTIQQLNDTPRGVDFSFLVHSFLAILKDDESVVGNEVASFFQFRPFRSAELGAALVSFAEKIRKEAGVSPPLGVLVALQSAVSLGLSPGIQQSVFVTELKRFLNDRTMDSLIADSSLFESVGGHREAFRFQLLVGLALRCRDDVKEAQELIALLDGDHRCCVKEFLANELESLSSLRS